MSASQSNEQQLEEYGWMYVRLIDWLASRNLTHFSSTVIIVASI